MGNEGSKGTGAGGEMQSGVRNNLYPWRDMIQHVYAKCDSPGKPLTQDLVLEILQNIEPHVQE